jgi:hypothetical protein
MKKNLFAAVISLFISVCIFAQTEEEQNNHYAAPKWVSEKGYWVIETSKQTPQNSIVYFYTNEHVLVYKEKVEGVVLNLNKRKIKMSLKKVLEQSVYAYEKMKKPAENEMWVMNIIRH